MKEPKKEISDEKLLKTYKTAKEREDYLASLNKDFKKVRVDDKIAKIIKTYQDRAEEGRERFTKKVKQQEYYQVQCPKCKISNRKWVESGGDIYDIPIINSQDKSENEYFYKAKYQKQWIYLTYYCKRCNYYFP